MERKNMMVSFGLTPACLSVYLWFSLRCLDFTLPYLPEACIQWQTRELLEEMLHYASLFRQRDPDMLDEPFALVDFINIIILSCYRSQNCVVRSPDSSADLGSSRI